MEQISGKPFDDRFRNNIYNKCYGRLCERLDKLLLNGHPRWRDRNCDRISKTFRNSITTL